MTGIRIIDSVEAGFGSAGIHLLTLLYLVTFSFQYYRQRLNVQSPPVPLPNYNFEMWHGDGDETYHQLETIISWHDAR